MAGHRRTAGQSNKQADTLFTTLVTLGETVNTPTHGFQLSATGDNIGATHRDKSSLLPQQEPRTPSLVCASDSSADVTIPTNFRALFVPRDLEILYGQLKLVLDPDDKRQHNETEAFQKTDMDRGFIVASHHFYRSLPPESQPQTDNKDRKQRQRGIPALKIPMFQTVGEFFDWFMETDKKGEERRANLSRLHKLKTRMEDDNQAVDLAADAISLQFTEKLKKDICKLTKKARKWDMQLRAFLYCHHICGRLVASIDRMESGMKRRQSFYESVDIEGKSKPRTGLGNEGLGPQSEPVLQDDFIDRFMVENRIHQCEDPCKLACSEGPEAWARRSRQLILDCVNKHAVTVRGKVSGREPGLAVILFHT